MMQLALYIGLFFALVIIGFIGLMIGRRMHRKDFVPIELPEELLAELKKCQHANSELKKLGMDDLVTFALKRYLRAQGGKPTDESN
jgi:hypothetical protein